jgi:hypothetical protein
VAPVAGKEQPQLAGPSRPLGVPEIPQFYLPAAGKGTYTPRVYGAANIQFADRKRGLEEKRRSAFLAPIHTTLKTLDWDAARAIDVTPDQLLKTPPVDAPYGPLPASAMQLNTFTRWAKAFDRWLARTQRVEFVSKSDPNETVSLGPKRGGVSVELVAIVWELTP